MTWLAPGGGADRNVYLSMKGMREDYEIHLAVGRQIERDDLLKLHGSSHTYMSIFRPENQTLARFSITIMAHAIDSPRAF